MGANERTDENPNHRPELEITPITFKVFSENITKVRRQFLSPEDIARGGPYIWQDFRYIYEEGKRRLLLVATFHPPLFGGRVDIRMQGFGVDNSSVFSLYEDQHTHKPVGDTPRELMVFNIPIEQLKDPSIIDNVRQLNAAGVMVVENQVQANKLGGFVADQEVRALILEYANIDPEEVEKYSRLRVAATNKTSVPGFGHFTYEDVKTDSQERRLFFNEEDLKWLETFMRNKGIPLPS